MSKTTWADVEKGDVVELAGREYRVVKIKKLGKKKSEVMVETKGRYAESIVKRDGRVKVVRRKADADPLLDADGRARRWATKKEAAEVGVVLKPGDADVRKPPTKAKGGAWEKPAGKTEKMVADLLSARLVAETNDEEAGYYVPPVDVSSVASHLVLFHAYTPPADEDEGSMLAYHAERHALALRGEPLPVNHWHTSKRPRFEPS